MFRTILMIFTMLALTLGATAQELGTISREVPSQLGVYDVKLVAGAEAKKGDIVKVTHKKGVGEATIMSVTPTSIRISLKGVYEAATGDKVTWARSPGGSAGGGWGAEGAGSSTSTAVGNFKSIPVPHGFTKYEGVEGRFTIAIPERSDNRDKNYWTNMKGPYRGNAPDEVSVSVRRFDEDLPTYLKYLKSSPVWGPAARVKEGEAEFGGKTYRAVWISAPPVKKKGYGERFNEYFLIFTTGTNFEVHGQCEVSKDKNLIERSLRTFQLTL